MIKIKDGTIFHSKVLVQLFTAYNIDGSRLRDKLGRFTKRLKDESIVFNTVTNVGDAWVANQLSGAAADLMSHMAIGTDNDPAPAVTDTTLNAELDRNALTSTTQGAGGNDNDIIYVGDWAAGDGTGAIVEAGIFNDAAAGTMLCRAIFAVKNKLAADTLKITWTFTCGAS